MHLLGQEYLLLDANKHGYPFSEPGAAGENPSLPPGARYEYHGYVELPTQWGTLEGELRFLREDGETLRVPLQCLFLIPGVEEFEPEP